MNRRWLRWGLGVFLVIAVFFLWEEHREERGVEAEFGGAWRAHAAVTPRWVPQLGERQSNAPRGGRVERPV